MPYSMFEHRDGRNSDYCSTLLFDNSRGIYEFLILPLLLFLFLRYAPTPYP